MKNIQKVLLAVLFSMPVLASCGGTGDSSESTSIDPTANDPETVIVRFVPSNAALADPTMLLKIKSIEYMLEEKIPDHDFDLAVSTDYEALTEAMVSEQVHVGFLTSQQYAYVTTEEPGKVNVILSSVRDAYNAQIDGSGNEITDKATLIANVNATGYNASYHETAKATSYYSMLLVRKADYNLGLDTVAELVGKKIGTGAASSGSGYVYPAVLLNSYGYAFTTSSTPSAGQIQNVAISGGHQSQITALLNHDVDATFAYLDARLSSAFDAYNAVEGQNVFADTKVIDLSTGIKNDTISVVSSLSAELQAQIQDAFIEIIATDVGKTALSVYSHTGYQVAVDADYDGERDVYVFKRDHLS